MQATLVWNFKAEVLYTTQGLNLVLKSLTTTSFVRLSDGRLFALWIQCGAADCHFSNYGSMSES